MFAVSHHFEQKLDPDPHFSDDPDSDRHKSEKLDPDRHQAMPNQNIILLFLMVYYVPVLYLTTYFFQCPQKCPGRIGDGSVINLPLGSGSAI